MRKTLIIALHQFKRLALHWTFFFTLLTPLLMILFGGVYTSILAWSATLERSTDTLPAPNVVVVNNEPFAQSVGVVDLAGLITHAPPDLATERLVMLADEESAHAAAAAGLIAGYYLVPADYVASGLITYISPSNVQFPATDQAIEALLVINLARADGEAVGRRLAAQPAFETLVLPIAAAPGKDIPDPILLTDLGITAGVSVFILFTIGNACNLFLSQLGRERQGRVLEAVLGMVSARQLLAGKYLGLAAVGLVETLAWGLWARLLALAGNAFGGPALAQQINSLGRGGAPLNPPPAPTLAGTSFDPAVNTPAGLFALCGLVLVSGYLAYMAMAAVFGAVTQDTRQASRVNTLLSILAQSPLLVTMLVLADRDGPLALFFSLFPLTSPLLMTVRILTSPVPLWQVGLSAAILLGWAGLMLGWAARLFEARRLLDDTPFWARLRRRLEEVGAASRAR